MSDGHARSRAVKDRVLLSSLIGRTVKLVRRGREFSGLCPFHQERSPSFTVVDDKGFAHCFGCGWHGSAIDFVMARDGVDFGAALERLENDAGLTPATPAPAQRASIRQSPRGDLIKGRRAAAWVWQAGETARGHGAAAQWLESRGIDPLRNGLLDVARFVPDCPAGLWRQGEDPRSVRRRAPALVLPILRVGGEPGARELALSGVHITFLSPDGRGKAQFPAWRDRRSGEWRTPPARVMWGVAARGAVPIPARAAAVDFPYTACRPGERPLPADWIRALIDGKGPVVIGEGAESTQSLLARQPHARMAWATLSLGNLEGVAAKDGPQGALPLWKLRGEAELGAPFTFAQPGDVVIGVDADMKPLKDRLVQDRPGAKPVKRDIAGAERATICAGLAAWHWTRAGARSVAVARPPAGQDFNDLDRERAA